MDTSFIFHPTTHRLPVPACPRSLYLSSPPTSYGSFTAWRHLGHSHYLLLFVPLSFFPAQAPSSSRSREETGTRFPLSSSSAAVSLCFSYFSSPSSAPPFCSPALSAHISLLLSLCPPPSSSFFRHFSSVLTVCLEYFGNYSGRFRVCFFHPETCNISRSYYSPFPFRVLL